MCYKGITFRICTSITGQNVAVVLLLIDFQVCLKWVQCYMKLVTSGAPLAGHPWPSVCTCTRACARVCVFQDLYLGN